MFDMDITLNTSYFWDFIRFLLEKYKITHRQLLNPENTAIIVQNKMAGNMETVIHLRFVSLISGITMRIIIIY